MLRALFLRLWKDESGVVATEYLLLGSVVTLGSVAGMAEMRDMTNNEFKDLGQSIHQTRQAYTLPALRGGPAQTNGASAVNRGIPNASANPAAQSVESLCPIP